MTRQHYNKSPGSLPAQFFHYVSRSVLGMIGLSCYILADTFFISLGLGADGLAALNLAIPVYSVISACGILAGTGGSIRYAVSRGAGKQEEGNRAFSGAMLLCLLIAVPLLTAGLFFAGPLSILLGADSATLAATRIYLQTLLLFSPAFLANQVLLFFVRADGGPGLAMAAMLTGSFSNILLDWVFIFPLRMGMFGAVLATCIAPLLSMAVLSSRLLRRKNGFQFGRVTLRAIPAMLRQLCALGGGAWFTEVSSGLVIVLFNLIFLRLGGNTAVAAYGIVANLSLVALSVFNGVAQGVQPLLSGQYGKGNQTALRRIFRLTIIVSFSLSLLLWGVILAAASPLAGAFNQGGDPELTALAAQGLRLYFGGFLFAGVNLAATALFSACGRPAASFTVSLLRGFLLLAPLALLCSLLGENAVWLAVPATEALTALVVFILLRTKRG